VAISGCRSAGDGRIAPAPNAGLLRGSLVVGFEQAAFSLCPPNGACDAAPASACWFLGSHEVWTRINALGEVNGRDVQAGNPLEFKMVVRGTRRDAEGERGFGHMSMYRCEIDATQVIEIVRTR
jgi:hypothetical protein